MMERELFGGDSFIDRIRTCAAMECYSPLFTKDESGMVDIMSMNSIGTYSRIRSLFACHNDHNLVAEIIRLGRL